MTRRETLARKTTSAGIQDLRVGPTSTRSRMARDHERYRLIMLEMLARPGDKICADYGQCERNVEWRGLFADRLTATAAPKVRFFCDFHARMHWPKQAEEAGHGRHARSGGDFSHRNKALR